MLSISISSTTKYPILFTENPFAELKKFLKKDTRLAVITDANMQKHYGREIVDLRSECSLDIFSFSANEQSKTLNTVQELITALQQYSFRRTNTVIIALGGGIVGDVAGFVASIYMRGVSYIQIPTTLLAMVDSSIGGKTGVNTPYGKNMVGSFYHPQAVIISSLFLKTLPDREISNGLAEMVKHTVIDGKRHFNELKGNIEKIRKRQPKICLQMIKKSINVKKKLVEQDEKEQKGIRSFVNFGHTVGHAIEKASRHTIPHGYAVAIGMVMESTLAEEKLGFKGREELTKVLEKCGLPTSLPASVREQSLQKFMRRDKKNEAEMITYALPRDFGKMEVKSF